MNWELSDWRVTLGGAVDVVSGRLYRVRDATARCSLICLAVNIMEEDEVGP